MEKTQTPQIKTYRIRQPQKNGVIYVQERDQYYDPDLKKNVYLKTRLIGKILPGTDKMVETRAKAKSEPKLEGNLPVKKATRERVGLMQILEKIGELSGIDEALYAAADNRAMAEKIISLARFLVATKGASFKDIESWQMTHPIPYAEGITQSVYLELFNKIGHSEYFMQNFFYLLCSDLKDRAVLAYDSTKIQTYSNLLDEAAYGYDEGSGSGKKLKVYKIITFYSIETRKPVAFSIQRGNIPDSIAVKNALCELQILHLGQVTLVFDNGFYSTENIGEILHCGFDFLIKVKPSLEWVAPLIDEHRNEIRRAENFCPFDKKEHGIKVEIRHTFYYERQRNNKKTGKKKGDLEPINKKVYLYIFFNQEKSLHFQEDLENSLHELKELIEQGMSVERMKKDQQDLVKKYLDTKEENGRIKVSYNQTAIDNNVEKAGWTVLLSNLNMDTFETLHLYRIREYIEEFFKEGKQDEGMDRPRTGSREELIGRTFVEFVALNYEDYLRGLLRDLQNTLGKENGDKKHDRKGNLNREKALLKWLNDNSFHQVLKWFDGFEETKVSTQLLTKRWSDEMVKRDRLLLEKLGVV